MWITSFVVISPIYIFHGQTLILGEYICRVPKDNAFSIAYTTLIIYGIPFNSVAFTYFQVHRFLRRQATSTIIDVRSRSRHRRRDIVVLRRIIITVSLLGSYGMPNSVMLIIFVITGNLVTSFYRILELSFAAMVLTLSVALFYVTPQLREEVKIFPRRSRPTVVVAQELRLKQQIFNRIQSKTTTQKV
jgi:hypothetical protein